MTPAATPQTATRITRSGSPPIAFQRRDVSQTHARIATSSVSPYRWMCSGPTLTMPVCGDGIDASTRRLSSSYGLEEDLEREVDRAAELDQLDRAVQVDVVALGQLSCGSGVVPCPLELLGPPANDAVGLGLFD